MLQKMKRAVPFVIVFAITIATFFGFFDLWGMPESGQVALAILLIAATLWISEAVPLYVTSFLILGLGLTWLIPVLERAEIEITSTVFLAPFFSDIILLFLGGFVLAAAFQRYGLDERMARWVIRQTGRSIPRFLFGIMLITAFLSMWLSNTATTAMMMTLCYPITQRLAPGDRARKGILLAIPFAANVGGLGTPIGSPANAIAIQYLQDLGAAPSFGTWMLLGIPAAAIMLVIAWVMLLSMYRGEAKIIELEPEGEGLNHSFRATLVLVVSGVTILGWLTGPWHGYSTGTVALLPVIVFFGGRLLSQADFRGLSWDILFLMGGGLCLGAIIDHSGLAELFISRMPTEGLHLEDYLIVLVVAACLMSSIMSNTAAANLILPIVIGLQNVALPPLMVGVAFACTMAMALPISTPPNAIAFSSGGLSVKEMVRPGLLMSIIGIALTGTVFFWWWKIVGLF